MKTEHNVRLTAAEIAFLWSQYMGDCLAVCALKYFLAKVEDSEIRHVVEIALGNSVKHLQMIRDIFEHEGHPIPVGLTDEDVNVDAPRLFSDVFILYYVRYMGMFGMASASMGVAYSARSDVSDFFQEVLASATKSQDLAKRVELEKGVYIRPPYISTPDRVDFVQKESFLQGFFGERRALTGMEITHLFANTNTNIMGKAMMLGFAQTAQCDRVREYVLRGKELSAKQIREFSTTLNDEDIPSPMLWDTHVLDSTEPPFSDKLMMYHTMALNSVGVANQGTAIASNTRRDLVTLYTRLIAEIGLYAEDGVELMIDKGWFEQPPKADDRKKLTQKQYEK